MSSHIRDLFNTMKIAAAQGNQQLHVTFGELSAYDPVTGCGKFLLPLHRDANDNPIETGFLQIGTPYAGPGYGAQFPPPLQAQALIVYVDLGRIYPVAATFLSNDIDQPPFTDGKSAGWKDNKGTFVKTTQDGSSPGDGHGGARVGGGAYASVTGTSLVEIGAEGLAAGKAAITKDDLVAALASQMTQIVNTLTTWASLHLQGGSGASGPPSIPAGTVNGSTKVKIED